MNFELERDKCTQSTILLQVLTKIFTDMNPIAFYFSHMCAQSYLTLSSLMDYRPPGSSVHGILQKEYWNGLPFSTPGDLPDTGIEPSWVTCIGRWIFFTTSATWQALLFLSDTQMPILSVNVICLLLLFLLFLYFTFCYLATVNYVLIFM